MGSLVSVVITNIAIVHIEEQALLVWKRYVDDISCSLQQEVSLFPSIPCDMHNHLLPFPHNHKDTLLSKTICQMIVPGILEILTTDDQPSVSTIVLTLYC